MENAVDILPGGVGGAVHPNLARRLRRDVVIEPRRGDDEIIVREVREIGARLGHQQRAVRQFAADVAARPPDHAAREGGAPDRLKVGAHSGDGIIGARWIGGHGFFLHCGGRWFAMVEPLR